jgi:Phytanoyl-CoA dioxygenase (PhyH)
MASRREQVLRALGSVPGLRTAHRRLRYSLDPLLDAASRIRETAYRGESAATPSGRAAQLVEALRRDGIVQLPEHVTGDRLSKMRAAFEATIAEVQSAPPAQKLKPQVELLDRLVGIQATHLPEYEDDPSSLTTYTRSPFRHAPEFLQLALDELVLDVAEGYLGRGPMLQDVLAYRYRPMEPRDFSSWQWHHDGLGTKLNMMMLLTDVGENDQYMTYLRGTHRLLHGYRKTVESRFSNDDVDAIAGARPLNCTCKAGSLFLFDSNGIHRGRRSLGATRDTLFNCYNAGRQLWPFAVKNQATAGLSERQRAFLGRNPLVRYV